MYNSLIIDVSNLYHRAYSVSETEPIEIEGEPVPVGGVYVALNMIKRLRGTYLLPGGSTHFLFDNHSSLQIRRKDLDPEYKANRKGQDPLFYKGLDYLFLLLQVWEDNCTLSCVPQAEADDIVPVILDCLNPELKVLMVSNDFDWARSIKENVHWLVKNGKVDEIYTPSTFEQKYGFFPTRESICFYKSIRGDSSDNIPSGIKGMREEMLLDLIKKVPSVQSLYANLYSLDLPQKWKDELAKNKGRVSLNHSLVDYKELNKVEVLECTEKSKFQPAPLELLYRVLLLEPHKVDSRFKPKKEELSIDDFFGEEQYPRI